MPSIAETISLSIGFGMRLLAAASATILAESAALWLGACLDEASCSEGTFVFALGLIVFGPLAPGPDEVWTPPIVYIGVPALAVAVLLQVIASWRARLKSKDE